jgi:hypothetical protein
MSTTSEHPELGDLDAYGDDDAHTGPMWVILLAGPVTWAVHFFVVYLLVEAACNIDSVAAMLSPDRTRTVVLAATVIAVGICGVFVVRSRRILELFRDTGRDHPQRFVATMGLLMGSIFAVAVVAVGVPALWLSAC